MIGHNDFSPFPSVCSENCGQSDPMSDSGIGKHRHSIMIGTKKGSQFVADVPGQFPPILLPGTDSPFCPETIEVLKIGFHL